MLTDRDLDAIGVLVRSVVRTELREFAALGRPRDHADDELLLAIAGSTCGRTFTSADLWKHRFAAPPLATALERADIDNPRQLGKLLARLEGRCLEGWRLERFAAPTAGIVWRCVQVSSV